MKHQTQPLFSTSRTFHSQLQSSEYTDEAGTCTSELHSFRATVRQLIIPHSLFIRPPPMHPSRQALPGGGNNRNPPNSYDSPPHLRSQNPSYGSRQASFNYGGSGPDSGGTLGSSTNSIPLAGRGRWGQSRLNAGVDLNVPFAEQGEEKRKDSQRTEPRKTQGWGERSGGAVGSASDGSWRRTSKVEGGETAASGGDQGDIWGTIPTTKPAEEKDDSGWRKPVQTDSGWGQTNQVQDQNPDEPSSGGWGWGATQVDQQQATSSGWDVPPPTDASRPRSNASSSKSNKASAKVQSQPQSHQSLSQPNFRPRSQLHSQTQAPRYQEQSYQQQSQHQQQQLRSNQPYPEPAYVAPIRTESSGWYDYATPPPQFSGFSGLPNQNHSQLQQGVASGWGAPAPAPVPASTGLSSSRGSRAIEIKDPNQVIPSPSTSGWNTPANDQHQHLDQSQTIQQSTQTPLAHTHAEPQGTSSDWDTPTTNIQRWTKSVDQASASRAPGSEPEVDGMDVRGSDVGWGSGGSEKSDKDKDQDQKMGEAEDYGWDTSVRKEEKQEEGDGWGVTAITGGTEVQDDGWGKAVQVPDNGGWGVATVGKAGQHDGWGKPVQASNNANGRWGQSSTDRQSTGWGQPSTETQTTGWGTPAPPQRSTSGKSHADREREGASYPTRSPMDERQQLGPAAKGLIQRHLGGGGVGGSAAGKAASGGRKMPERPPPKTNPFDVAAGDIWSVSPGQAFQTRSRFDLVDGHVPVSHLRLE